jgi:hypothetical protein
VEINVEDRQHALYLYINEERGVGCDDIGVELIAVMVVIRSVE